MDTQNVDPPAINTYGCMTADVFIKTVLPGWADWSPDRRRATASAFRCLAVNSDTPLSAIRMTQPCIAAAVTKAAKACRPVSPNYRSLIGASLKRVAAEGRPVPDTVGLTPDWRELVDQIPCKFDRIGVSRFVRYCSSANIPPTAVTCSTLARFEDHLAMICQELDPASVGRSTVKAWRSLIATVPGWPAVPLARRTKPHTHTLPFSAYPESFQRDIEAYRAQLGFNGLPGIGRGKLINPYARLTSTEGATAKRRRRPARPASIKARIYQLQQAAAALVHKGHKPEDITSLRYLVEPFEHAETIATYYWDRADHTPNGSAAEVVMSLRLMARDYCNLLADLLEEMADWYATMAPKHRGRMMARNAKRLIAIVEPSRLRILLCLPQTMMALADQSQDQIEAARLALYAVAVEILLICPMRLLNLRHLRLGINIVNVAGLRKGGAYFWVDCDDTKNGERLHWPIPAESGGLIQHYLTKYRPALANPDCDYLFPGETGDGCRSECGMRDALVKPAAERGIQINPHLMRHLAALIFLRHNPGQYEMLRRLLGHKRVTTTISAYTGLETQFNVEIFHRLIFDVRRRAKVSAVSIFSSLAPQPPKPKGGR